MTVTLQPIEKEIKEIRFSFGCTQEIMSRAIGVSSKTIFRWENGKTYPTPLAEKKIMELEKLKEKILEIFKPEVAVKWLRTPNKSLGDRTPFEEMAEDGIDRIMDILISIEWGIAL